MSELNPNGIFSAIVLHRLDMARFFNQVPVFAYVTALNAPSYRAIIQLFFEAKQQYVIEMRPVEIQAALGERKYELAAEDHDAFESAEKLNRLLEQLVVWGNLNHAHDAASVNRIEDFSRKRFIYHLTSTGEAAHRAILEVEATLGKTGSLQASMLRKILETLDRIAREARSPEPSADSLMVLFHDLFSAFSTLTEEANHFIAELTSHTGAIGSVSDEIEERFFLRKQAILDYISRFVDQLRQTSEEIASGIESVSAIGIHKVIQRASQSADLPPDLGTGDSLERWRNDQIAKWNGIQRWFIPESKDSGATVERLAKVAVEAVVALTRALSRVNELRTEAIDRAADFRTLAQWFSVLADDKDAHALWQTAFGLYASRHFHLVEEDAEATAIGASWWDTPPVYIPVRLGVRGKASIAGRAGAVPDHAKSKALILARRLKEREETQEAILSFARRGPFRVGDLKSVSSRQAEALLSIFDHALRSAPSSDGSRSVRTSDGKYRIYLSLPSDDGNNDEPVLVSTPKGLLRCRDFRIHLREAANGVS